MQDIFVGNLGFAALDGGVLTIHEVKPESSGGGFGRRVAAQTRIPLVSCLQAAGSAPAQCTRKESYAYPIPHNV
jgi:hypothetical protein